MHYTKEEYQYCYSSRPRGTIDTVGKMAEDNLDLQAELTTLREKAAAVDEAWNPTEWGHDSHLAVTAAVDNLRIAAGLPKRAITLPKPKGPEVTP